MIRIIESAPDVVAIGLRGKVKAAELEAAITLVESALERNGKTHIFAEIEDFQGIEPGALAGYLPRALAMLGKLDRFGRIAVVSDQAWVRAATRLESALLPRVSYEVFDSAERDRALAWVQGRRALPHGPSIRIIETDKPDVLGFEVDGKISAAEMEMVAAYFARAAEKGRPTRLLGRFRRFAWAEIGSFLDLDYYRMKLDLLGRLERYALVGGPAWLGAWAALLDPLFKVELRHFPAEDEAAAWEWLGARPVEEHSLAA